MVAKVLEQGKSPIHLFQWFQHLANTLECVSFGQKRRHQVLGPRTQLQIRGHGHSLEKEDDTLDFVLYS